MATTDELADYGLQRMDDNDIERYLALRRFGVLGLPTGAAPYLVPMAYGYDGGRRLYFNFVVGAHSRKRELSEAAESASFLVYNAESMYHWQSVALVGSIRKLAESEYTDVKQSDLPPVRPELLDTASESEETQLYEFSIETKSGVKHSIEPPMFWQRSSTER